ncbi:type 1 fimbrial protein [Enterobacter hormaechei]
MRKFSLILLTFIISVMPTISQANSDSASITIIGRVLANTCTIDNGSARQTIILPDVSDRDFHSVGVTIGETPVSIRLNDCGSDIQSVVVKVSGDADSVNTEAFNNSYNGQNKAEGIAINFYRTDGISFLPNGSNPEEIKLAPGNNEIVYKTSYISTTEKIVGGNVVAVVNLQFDYK